MNRFILLLLFLLFMGSLLAQTSSDVAACLRACLETPGMKTAFTQEWGELRPLYLRKREAPGIGNRPTDDALNQLAAADFQGLPWEVIPATREEISQLPAEEAEFGVLEASIGFREGQAAASFFINLPRYPRKWMSCSFLLEKRGAQWAVFEQSIEVLP